MVMTYGKGAGDINQYARLGSHGQQEGNIHRDLLVLIGTLITPEPVDVDVPVVHKNVAGRTTSMQPVSIFLPHDWFATIAEQGLMHRVFGSHKVTEFWEQINPLDPRLHKNSMTQQVGWEQKFIPFIQHADGGPHQKHDSILVTSMKSLLTELSVDVAMLLLGAVPEACRASVKKCKDLGLPFLGDTEEFLGTYWAWSWNAVFEGKHPTQDPFGNPFPKTSHRAKVAGKSLDPVTGMKGCIWLAPADCKHLSVEYGFPSSSADNLCMRCKANSSDMPWNDFSKKALWRLNVFTPHHLAMHPFSQHWLMRVKGVSSFTFVYDPMHCMEIGPVGTAIANVFFDATYKEYKGTKAQRLNQLMAEVQDAYKSLHIGDCKISHLEYNHFCDKDAPHKNFPDLMSSAVKARQVRYLVPVAAKLSRDFFKPGDEYSRHRLQCLENAEQMYNIVDEHGLFLGADATRFQEACHNFCVHYACLTKLCQDSDCKQWPIRPKLHYIAHIGLESKWMSPRAMWCYTGEHMVGNVTALAQACLAGTPPHNVPGTLSTKYRVAKHLQFIEEL
jgi:hypothetical protein